MSDFISEGYSKKFHTERLRKFWTERWSDRRSIKDLLNLIGREGNSDDSQFYLLLMKDMIRKLFLDNVISLVDAHELWKQVKSPDPEVRYLALTLLRIKAPTKFYQDEQDDQ